LSGGLIALIGVLAGERKEGEKAGHGGFRAAAAAGRRAGGRRKEGGEREADRWGPGVSGSREKEKGEGEGGPAREAGWAAWAEKEPVQISFFSLPFSNFIFKPNFISISIQTFLKNFINFLETTQATKNHASQLMMHIHLLSLSLLIYL
jgi:hypothetical protein